VADAGLEVAYAMPAMLVEGSVEDHPPPRGIELTRVRTAGDAEGFWRVAADAYRSNGFPPEVFAHYEDHEGLWAANVAAFLARQEGEPVGIAMTIVNHGVAGIYCVGSTKKVRGRGLGWTMTATAVNAGLEMGVETAALQASPMGEPLYLRMGFETVFNYRLFLHNAH